MADLPDFSTLQDDINRTVAQVSLMKAQLSSMKNMLASKEREFENVRQERQNAGIDETIAGALSILRKSSSMDISEMATAIEKLNKNAAHKKNTANVGSIDNLPLPPFETKE